MNTYTDLKRIKISPIRILTTITITLVVLIFGCKKDTFIETIGTCPTVETTSPSNGATLVALNKIISVSFNEEMNPTTITEASIILSGSVVPGKVSYIGKTAYFSPTSPLIPNHTYTGRVTTSVKDVKGNALQTDYVWTFSTGAILKPAVISTDPTNNATGVFLNQVVKATFSAVMDPLSISATTFILKQGPTDITGTVSYSGTTANFKPSIPLSQSTTYTAIIKSSVKDLNGNNIQSDYVWEFNTGTIISPTVISTNPANKATGVAQNKIISAEFSQSMDPLTLNVSTFTLMLGATAIPGTVSYSGTIATFTPSSNLVSGTYTATITNDTKNLGGISLVNDYVWSFSTSVTIGTPIVNLKSVGRFGIIAGVGVSNNAGFSVINNIDVGISPGVRSSITGFPPAKIVNGAMFASDDISPPGTAAMLLQAKKDLAEAYLFAEGATFPAPVTVSGDQGGKTLAPGIYKTTSTLLIQSGNLTLDAKGDVNASWIFQIASDFTTIGGAGGNVILAGGAQAKNIFWQIGSSATIGDYTIFKGNVLALTSITMNSHAVAEGRMLARNGAVVMTHTNTINKP